MGTALTSTGSAVTDNPGGYKYIVSNELGDVNTGICCCYTVYFQMQLAE